MELLLLIDVDFNVTDRLIVLIIHIHCTYEILKTNGNAVEQCISYKYTTRKLRSRSALRRR
jgi:hypothetical protein